MAADLSELTNLVKRLETNLGAEGQRKMARAAAVAGRTAALAEASSRWGGDRKFSGSRRSVKARRVAGVRYKQTGTTVEWLPTGDPWYITLKGRGNHVIRPRKAKALRTPAGPRARAHGGRLAPRPDVYDHLVTRMRQPVLEAMHNAQTDLIRQSLAG